MPHFGDNQKLVKARIHAHRVLQALKRDWTKPKQGNWVQRKMYVMYIRILKSNRYKLGDSAT